MSAKTSSVGVTPARASIRNRHTSAISTARSVSLRIRPCNDSSVASSRPAVSITVKRRSPSLASPSRRSRVTPGWSSTSARRLPTRRLNSVDLPTFGRPTMARVKLMSQAPGRIKPPCYSIAGLTESVQLSIGRHDIKRASRHHGVGRGTARQIDRADQRAVPRIEKPQQTVARGHNQLSTGHDRAVMRHDLGLAPRAVLGEKLQLDRPDLLAIFGLQADQFVAIRDHVDRIARRPHPVQRALIGRPQPLAIGKTKRHHSPRVTADKDLVAVDHRIAGDIGDARTGIALALTRDLGIPEPQSALTKRALNLGGTEGEDHVFLGHGRRRTAHQVVDIGCPPKLPADASILRIERQSTSSPATRYTRSPNPVGLPVPVARRFCCQRSAPVSASSAVISPNPEDTKSRPSPKARPPPDASLAESLGGTRSRRHSTSPEVETALTWDCASSVKMRPPATTGSAVMRTLRPSPAPIEVDQMR